MHEPVSAEEVLDIPPPDGEREPLKVNIFEFAAGSSCQLQPVFPHNGPGAIVPCVAILRGGAPEGHYGHFYHGNSVEEVSLTWASRNGMLGPGSLHPTAPVHGVNSFLKDPSDPEAFALISITQHQAEQGDQQESIIFRCSKCDAEVVRLDYDASAPCNNSYDPSQWGGSDEDTVPMFATVWGSAEATRRYNEESARTCRECGHVNAEHPEPLWGWQRFVDQTRAANEARRVMAVAADAPLSEGVSS